ncbi:MAG: MFS transporter [Holophagales bacterium]|nr:MFS transporter [Holophagales bacterium]
MEQAYGYSRFRWFMLATVTFGYVTCGLLIILFAPVLGDVAATYGLDLGQATLAAMATYYFSSAVAVLISGPLIDRFGARPTIVAGGVLLVAGCLLVPVLGGTVGGLVLTRVIMGLGSGPISACVPAVAARWFPPHERGIFAGAQGSGMAIGVALGFGLMPAAVQANGDWRAAAALLAIVPAISLVLCIVTLFAKEPAGAAPAVAEAGAGTEFGKALKEPAFWVGVFGMFAFVWIMNAFNQQTPGYLAVAAPLGLGLGPVAAGQKMIAVQVGMILGAIGCGIFLDKVLKGNARPLLVTGFLFSALFMVAVRFPFVHDSAALLGITLFFCGFFESFTIPALSAFMSLHYPQSIMGKVFAVSFGVSLFAGALGVGLGGAILHATNSYSVPIVLVGVVALLGAAVTATLKPPKALAASTAAREAA